MGCIESETVARLASEERTDIFTSFPELKERSGITRAEGLTSEELPKTIPGKYPAKRDPKVLVAPIDQRALCPNPTLGMRSTTTFPEEAERVFLRERSEASKERRELPQCLLLCRV